MALERKLKGQTELTTTILSELKLHPMPPDKKESDGMECIAIPCGHQSYCEPCCKELKHCAVCRSPVTGFYKTFTLILQNE